MKRILCLTLLSTALTAPVLTYAFDQSSPPDSLVVDVNGKVGIGTATPGGNLHIFGSSDADLFSGMGPDLTDGPAFNYGYAGASFGIGAGFFNVRPHASTIAPNPSLRFATANITKMIITNTGDVGIGNDFTAPASKLHVTGGDIRVTGGSFIDDGATLNVPDYVFEDKYDLMPLHKLKRFINEEKHLPGVKSAKEVKKEGLNISLSQMALLEKIEELTLYTLDQQDQLDTKKKTLQKQSSLINEQQHRISKLESMMQKINNTLTEKLSIK